MDPQAELNQIYESIGNGAECTDDLLQRIEQLEAIVNPAPEPTGPVNVGALCGDPYCDGKQCWDCAAIRGGDPMDA